MSISRRNVLIVLFLCLAAPTARSQEAVPSAPPPVGVESASPSAVLLPATTEARAAVLAEARWRAPEHETGGMAAFARRLGDLRVVGPALLAGYVTGRVRGLPDLSAASARVAGATVGAALLCGGLQATGERLRGGGSPFPSSRATIAFAAAAAVDAESRPGWVRWVVYPVAAGVAVADARGGAAGAGPALAGAALGLAAGHALDRIEHDRVSLFERARFLARGSRREFRVGFQARF